MIRAFIAVELSEALRAGLTILQQTMKRRIEPEVTREAHLSWVKPASIHLTLKFLGDMNEQLIDPLRAAIKLAIGTQLVISVPLAQLGAFPRPHNPRVLWVGPSEEWERGRDAKRVLDIQQAIEQACEGFGFAREARPFSPHLTVLRIKKGERHVGLAFAKSGLGDRPLTVGSLVVEAVVLMQSELRPTGPVYTKLWEVRLGCPAA
jgi:2'-5' RNA ligase